MNANSTIVNVLCRISFVSIPENVIFDVRNDRFQSRCLLAWRIAGNIILVSSHVVKSLYFIWRLDWMSYLGMSKSDLN